MEEGVAGEARARGYLAPSILTVAKRGHIICQQRAFNSSEKSATKSPMRLR